MTAPKLHPVESSWIATIGYQDGTLYVETRASRSRPSATYYGYLCPPWVYASLCAAVHEGESVGTRFDRVVRGRWPEARLEREAA